MKRVWQNLALTVKSEDALIFNDMEIGGIVEAWNARYGTQLPLTEELLDATFFSCPPSERFVIQTDTSCTFLKKEDSRLRFHLSVPLRNHSVASICKHVVEAVDKKAQELNIARIAFGGGDKHLFPGVPLFRDQRAWLECFSPSGEEVMDFQGKIDTLCQQAGNFQAQGELRPPKNKTEEKELLTFVALEFNGRWSREIEEDFQKQNIQHYFAYFIRGKIVGYVRLYGWDPAYWAPGVYFTSPGKGSGGLGPIGVAAAARGSGYGSEILKLSWGILKTKDCHTVRIDWTTERDFYEKSGLHVVQKYQPAVRC